MRKPLTLGSYVSARPRMAVGALVTVLAILVIPGTVSSAREPNARDQFKDDWKDRRVVLIQPLRTVEYQTSGGVFNPGRVDTRVVAVTLASPEKGTYYYAKPNGTEISDPDLERFMAQVTSATSDVKLKSFRGGNKRNVTASPAALLEYGAGTVMTVDDVYIKNEWIRLDLNDDFHTGGPNTTALLIEWPEKISKDFPVRAEVEELIREYLLPEAEAAAARIAARNEAIPEEFRDAADRGKVVHGMTKKTVFEILGTPADKQVVLEHVPPLEKWVYEVSALEMMVVTFEGGLVVQIDVL